MKNSFTIRRSTTVLLMSTLMLTIGRGATLPFMAVYLTRRFALGVDYVGYAMTIPMVIGVIFSLGLGLFADRFDKKRYLLLSIAAFIGGFVAIPLVDSVPLLVLFFALINCAYSVFASVLKAYFSDILAATEKAKIFSLNYTLLNIGWTLGPPIGTWLVMYSINLPFWLAAICAAFPLVLIQLWVQKIAVVDHQDPTAAWSPSVLLRDRALLWFTLSGLLASFVGGSFVSSLSQYVLVVADGEFADKVITVILPVNAAVVVSLQYAIGRKLTTTNLRPLMALGTLCFVLGLVGFMLAGSSLWFWGIAAAIFTLGEVIYAPGEYMLIDNIAPPGLKASYFSAQALGWLGAAFNPMLTGMILTNLPSWSLFAILITAIVAAWLMMIRGIKCMHNPADHERRFSI